MASEHLDAGGAHPSTPTTAYRTPHSHARSFSSDTEGISDSSTAGLILEHTDSDNDDDLSEIEDAQEDETDSPVPPRSPYTPALSHFRDSLPPASLPVYTTQLLLVSPTLLLGSSLFADIVYKPEVPETSSSKLLSILWLVLAALLATFSSQVWILLGRYIRKWTIEEVIAHALMGGGGRKHGRRQQWRHRFRTCFKYMIITTCLLLCTVYLRNAVDCLLDERIQPSSYAARAIVGFLCAGVVVPFILRPSMTSKRLVVALVGTLASHLALMIYRIVSFVTNKPSQLSVRDWGTNDMSFSLTLNLPLVKWELFGILVFAFASPFFAYPIYLARLVPPARFSASQKRPIPHVVHLCISALISFALLLYIPLTRPATESIPASLSSPVPILRSLIFILGIPQLYILAVSPRLPTDREINRPTMIRLYLLALVILLVTFTPSTVFVVLQRILILAVLFTTTLLPACAHIAIHAFRPPLSILLADTDEQVATVDTVEEARGSERARARDPPDVFLRRKELSLQRRRLGRRLVWDIGVWIGLLPAGLALCAWAAWRVIRPF